jgi:predicted short-subunit dehydrogenase-like oxidoreductase (DUF2520 family)
VKPKTAVIGSGRLARALLPLLAESGYRIVAVAARSKRSAARAIPAGSRALPTADAAEAVAGADLVLLAVPDREIAGVARLLAKSGDSRWRSRTVLHHAGALGPEPLRPLARQGAAVGVLHPFQVCADPGVARQALPGSAARIEGDARAVRVADRLARDLGLLPYRPARSFGPRERAAYHAAASLLSNDLVALLDLATTLLERQGMGRTKALRALLALARGTLAHAEQGGLDLALTGPVSRGDAATVAAQLRSLRAIGSDAAELHRLLGRRLLERSIATKRLTRAEAKALRTLLS